MMELCFNDHNRSEDHGWKTHFSLPMTTRDLKTIFRTRTIKTIMINENDGAFATTATTRLKTMIQNTI